MMQVNAQRWIVPLTTELVCGPSNRLFLRPKLANGRAANVALDQHAVKQGDELSLEIIVRRETKRKEGSWKTDVARDAQPPKAKAKAKTAANSLEVATEI